jgi:hypothetical protein
MESMFTTQLFPAIATTEATRWTIYRTKNSGNTLYKHRLVFTDIYMEILLGLWPAVTSFCRRHYYMSKHKVCNNLLDYLLFPLISNNNIYTYICICIFSFISTWWSFGCLDCTSAFLKTFIEIHKGGSINCILSITAYFYNNWGQ